ncbi:MAG: xylulokinase [Pseudomonadota bacterium]
MFLGIDIGTSSVKLSLLSAELHQIGEASANLTVQIPQPYHSEQDPEAWWQALTSACSDLATRHDLKQVTAIGLSGQMHGAVLLDTAGQIIRPAILWNDGRSHAECDEMGRAMPDIGLRAGVPPMPGFTAPKLRWLARHEPETHGRIAHVLLPKDYIGFRLHGGFVTDLSDAAGTHWLDQENRDWSDALCDISFTQRAWLPELKHGTDIAGYVSQSAAADLGLRPGLPVAAGGGDAATGAVGIGAIDDGTAFISLGTSGQLFVATECYRPNPARMVHAYCHTVPATWFQMAAMLNGARPLQWFADIVDEPVADLLNAAQGCDVAGDLTFLPYLTGERSPHGDPHIRGSFYGLADGTTRAQMMRAIVNAVAYSFADAFDSLRDSGTRISEVLAIGGGARSDLLLQTIADATGTTINRSADAVSGPAVGAAKLAAVASGSCAISDLASRPRVDRRFEPAPSDLHDEGLARFRTLYTRLKGAHLDGVKAER